MRRANPTWLHLSTEPLIVTQSIPIDSLNGYSRALRANCLETNNSYDAKTTSALNPCTIHLTETGGDFVDAANVFDLQHPPLMSILWTPTPL